MRSCGCAIEGAQWVGGAIFLAYLIPPSILFIPLSTVVFQYGLFDTPFALILTYPTILIPFSTWLLMGYFKTIPFELEECALIDGASRWQILTKIVLPLAIPGLISAFIFCFTLCWNEFIYALTFISSTQYKTVPVAIVTALVDGDIYRWGSLMAGAHDRLAAAGRPLRLLRRALRLGDDRRGEGIATHVAGFRSGRASKIRTCTRQSSRGSLEWHRIHASDGSGWAAWAIRWPNAFSRPATTSRSGIAPSPRPSRSPRPAARLSTSSPTSPASTSCSPSSPKARTSSRSISARRACSPTNKTPPIFVDCSTIAVEESVEIRKRLKERGADFICAPVSGNAKVIKAGKLSSVCSGPEASYRKVEDMIKVYAPKGVSYVGDGELARVCKIAHNVMLGVVIQNLIEITLLVNKMGVPRHAFLAFLNNGVMGSMFTAYKSPALVNLDWTTTFTPELLRKDLDLGLALADEADVPMPITAATRAILQMHMGHAMAAQEPRGISRQGLRHLDGNDGAVVGHEARKREQAGADRAGIVRLTASSIPATLDHCTLT